jgi:hypothetical protein
LPFGHVRAAATARPGQANPWRRPPVQIPGPDWPPHESYRFVAIAPPLTERRAAEDFFFWGSDYVTQQSSKKKISIDRFFYPIKDCHVELPRRQDVSDEKLKISRLSIDHRQGK